MLVFVFSGIIFKGVSDFIGGLVEGTDPTHVGVLGCDLYSST